MALPVLSTPRFELVLPSTGKKHKYRPFLVKEEKILLMALQGENSDEIIEAINDIVATCVEGIDINSIAIFDLEYAFIKIREKSISDEFTIIVKHKEGINSDGKECDHKQELHINLSDINVQFSADHDKKIQITDQIGVVMKYPTINIIRSLGDFSSETAFEIIAECIDYIYDNEKTYPVSEYKKSEIEDFVNSLSHQQLEKIEQFFETIPKVSHIVTWKCPKCKSEESFVLEGLNDFFT